MKSISRKAFARRAAAASTVFGTIGFLRFPADAAEYVLKYSSDLADDHPVTIRMNQAAEKIKQQTGGRVEIQTFANSILGGSTQQLSQLRSGAIQLLSCVENILGAIAPVASIDAVGFAFSKYSQVWRAMDGELGMLARSALAGVGIYAFERVWNNGFREITSSKSPINTPADLRGLKIRVPVSPLILSMFRSLGAAPAPINYNETYSALQTHIVDAQETPLVVIETAKMFEVQKFCSLTNHIFTAYWLLANADAWQALPKPLRTIIDTNVNAAALLERTDAEHQNATLQTKLESQGLAFNSPDPAPFRAALSQSGFYVEWRKTYGPRAWGVLEKYAGQLT